jgi:hypothetical protein
MSHRDVPGFFFFKWLLNWRQITPGMPYSMWASVKWHTFPFPSRLGGCDLKEIRQHQSKTVESLQLFRTIFTLFDFHIYLWMRKF